MVTGMLQVACCAGALPVMGGAAGGVALSLTDRAGSNGNGLSFGVGNGSLRFFCWDFLVGLGFG